MTDPVPTPVGPADVRRLLVQSYCSPPPQACYSTPCACAQFLLDEISRPLLAKIEQLERQLTALEDQLREET